MIFIFECNLGKKDGGVLGGNSSHLILYPPSLVLLNRGKIKAYPKRGMDEIPVEGKGSCEAKMRCVWWFSSTDKARLISRHGLLFPTAIAWLRSCILSRVLQILSFLRFFPLARFLYPLPILSPPVRFSNSTNFVKISWTTKRTAIIRTETLQQISILNTFSEYFSLSCLISSTKFRFFRIFNIRPSPFAFYSTRR